MKKIICIAISLVSLSFSAEAFALISYEQLTTTFTSDHTLNPNNLKTSFTFNGVANAFVNTPSLILALTGSQGHGGYSDTLKLTLNNTLLDSGLTTGPGPSTYTYTFTPTTLMALNQALSNNKVSFTLVRNTGSSSVSSATLKGTVAPEPASIALVGAGLVGLPFARRLRRSIIRSSV